MLINLFWVHDGRETVFATRCDHTECFPGDQESAEAALRDLQATGEHWVGGGAAPLSVLRPAKGGA